MKDLPPMELLRRLVAFDTVSAHSNLELIEFVAEYLEGHGVRAQLTHDDARQKANLFATVGPEDLGGVALSGHTDVVPVEGQPWSSDPFLLREADGRLYGRGTADMKGFIAIVLALLPRLKARRLVRPVHFAFTYDEEVGCHGVHRLLAGLPQDRPKPELVVVGEPTSLQVVTAHKGLNGFRTSVKGRAAHSSQTHLGTNAVSYAAELIVFLNSLAAEQSRRAEPQRGFQPPYTTLSVGPIEGGRAINIVPNECSFLWEFRPLPGRELAEIPGRLARFVEEELLPRAKERGDSPQIETTQIAKVPAFEADDSSPAQVLTQQLTDVPGTGAVAYTAEAGIYQEAGVPAVLCGPGSIDQAHRANEFLSLEQLALGTTFVERILNWAASPGAAALPVSPA